MSRTKFPNLSIMSRQKQRSDKDWLTKDFTTKKLMYYYYYYYYYYNSNTMQLRMTDI